MKSASLHLNEHQLAPVKTSDGRLWCQRCYVCDKSIDFLKDPSGFRWLRVENLVRHRKCFPGIPS